MSNPLDDRTMRDLIQQVQRAMPPGKTEDAVTTRISRPMWNRFCRATGMPENCKPTELRGIHNTRRVFGSRTIIVESDQEFSVSFVTPNPASEE